MNKKINELKVIDEHREVDVFLLAAHESDINKEREALECISEIADIYGDRLRVIWGWGDGDGGHVMKKLHELMSNASKKDPAIKKYKKKVIPALVREDVYVRDGYSCVYCGSNRSLTVDHIYPEVHG